VVQVSELTTQRELEVRQIVCEILEIDPAEVSRTSLFKEQHGADSLRAIEIMAALERTFDITIEQTDLGTMVNMEGVLEVVAQAAGWD
jgi:acyl carrier protein